MTKVRTRFAPSPTGYMHIGNLRTALYEYLVAKKDPDGVFILRIEDTDQGRLIEGATDIIYNTLAQCKLFHDEGPDVGGNYGSYVQSERMKSGIYKEYAEKLIDLGGAHYCFCQEEDIQSQRELAEARGESFIFNDPCKNISVEDARARIANGESYVVRQNIPTSGTTSFDDEVYGTITVENSTLDEAVLLKSDGYPTYNFANIIDDHMMEITHVIRGNEYLSSTPKYNLVYKAFGWDIPTYIHCPPVMKDEHHKLSKRNGDASFQDLVAKGYLPEAIINYIALLGWSPETEQEIYTLDELKQAFNVKRIGTSGAIFDIDKLTWMNGMYLRNMDIDTYYDIAKEHITNGVKGNYDHKEIAKILQQRANTLAEIDEMVDFFDTYNSFDSELYTNKKMKSNPEVALPSLKAARDLLASLPNWEETTIHDEMMALVEKLGIKNGQLLYPVRVAITGKQFTPGGAIEISYILGKDETLRRLDLAIQDLEK
ncbi:glutamate--tRNA ligase [Anaerorhabdus furcosa]|uniref:Glutamate--tRNA ligase n=1 Tax=Anaerorhabdus furcosa TaxID=118967 RepID=A0A1T4PEI2_9FIRM|nr:glutamate--tRNA ligase [Anaerorhabdus furcosa]SJZ89960.1 glutamyl-tRNA synthetase [Anaerorhabdus furcosa]